MSGTNHHTQDDSGINRRTFLQQASAAAGFASVGTAVAAPGEGDTEKRGTVIFAESAVTHDIEFPSAEVRGHSLIDVNTLPEHAVFVEEDVLSYTHHTTPETVRVLEDNPAGLWHEDYQGLPASDVGSPQNVWIGVHAIDGARLKHGALIEGPYRPPGFNISQRGETVRVTAGSKQAEVEPGERFRRELPARKVPVKISRPADGSTEEPEGGTPSGDSTPGRGTGGGPPHSVEQLTVRPTVNVKNYGEVEIHAPEDFSPRDREEPPKEVPGR